MRSFTAQRMRCLLPVVGFMSQRVDNRWLLFAGFSVFGIASLMLSFVNLEIGPFTLLVPIVVTGFGISFLFVPIGNMGTATLRNEEIGNATGIFNLLRNIGGSVGISIAQTELIRRACFHQSRLVAAVPQTSYWFQQDTTRLGQYLGGQMGRAASQPLALGALYRFVQQQAMLWAFIDIFRWTALIALLAGALTWMFRKVTMAKP
jgi:MFS transporter, DHA2 family, multidrug resistance protein